MKNIFILTFILTILFCSCDNGNGGNTPTTTTDGDELRAVLFYREELRERYIAYRQKEKLSASDAVLYVNIGLDNPPYTNTKEAADPSDLLVLINKYNRLPEGYEPDDLAVMPFKYTYNENGGVKLRQEALDALLLLIENNPSYDFCVKSGYRTEAFQRKIYENNLKIYPQEQVDKEIARPGFSEHQTGLAFDFTKKGHEAIGSFTGTKEAEFMAQNAHKYGFINRYQESREHITGYQSESWHYRYVGVYAATEIFEKGITLDEYIAMNSAMKK